MGWSAHKAVGPSPGCSWRTSLLALGAMVEPLIHPKPGGVTRKSGWRGMNIYTFAKAQAALHYALEAACLHGCREGCLAAAVRSYLSMLRRLGVRENANLGTLILMTPIACTGPAGDPEEHLRSAASCARGLGGEDAVLYYKALEAFMPSHLGYYQGPLPAVGSGEYPRSFLEILRGARWDYVHSELLEGYPKTLEAYHYIANRGDSEEEIALLLLSLLAKYGDTLIGRRHGWRAMLRAMAEARMALSVALRAGVADAIRWLRGEWSARGWTPGAVLDIVATALGVYYLYGPSRGG